MNADLIASLIVSGVTFIGSIATSAFIAGSRWGNINSEMRTINDRLAKIEGMFTLTIRKDEHSQ